jgi:phage portal protein BeeE
MATGAEVNYINMGRSLVEMAVLESETMSLRKIASHFRVDPGIVGDPAGSTFSNRADARRAAYTDAYIPALERQLQGLNEWLCAPYAAEGTRLELRARLDNIRDLQPDQVKLWQWLNMTGHNLTPNERREAAGMDRSEDPAMDQHYFELNLFANEDMGSEELEKYLEQEELNDYK